MSSQNESTKIIFEIKDIHDDLSLRETSFNLNNSDIKFKLFASSYCNWPEHDDEPIVDGKFTMVYLYLESSIKERVSIQYRFSIVNRSGKNEYVQEGHETFLTNVNSKRYGGLYKIDESFWYDQYNELIGCDENIYHEENGIAHSKRIKKFTICCEIKEIKLNCQTDSEPYIDTYLPNFQYLLESGKYADAVLFVGGKELKVHKNILSARSNVFNAMFEHDCEEKKQNRVEITDIRLDVMKEILRYIYTAKIESIETLALELLIASDKYELQELKYGCEFYLKMNLSVETVSDLLLWADLYHANELKSSCIDFILDNEKEVKNTRGWKTIATKDDLIVELNLKLKGKYEKLKGLLPQNIRKLKYYNYDDIKHIICSNFSVRNHIVNIGTLVGNEKFSDAVLILKDGELKVHKNILFVQSKVLADKFEQEQSRVELLDLSVDLCKQMLRYIYNRSDFADGSPLKLDKKYVNDLLMLSEKFQLRHLKILCSVVLCEQIDIESVTSTLLLADEYNVPYLKMKSMEYITENCRQVTKTEGWKTLAKTKPELVIQLYENIADKQWN